MRDQVRILVKERNKAVFAKNSLFCGCIPVNKFRDRITMQDIVSVRIAAVSRFQALDRLKLVDYLKSAVESSANGIKRYFVIAFLDPLIKLTLHHFLYTHIKTESVLPALHKIMDISRIHGT